jgi:hypothetical protein
MRNKIMVLGKLKGSHLEMVHGGFSKDSLRFYYKPFSPRHYSTSLLKSIADLLVDIAEKLEEKEKSEY